MDITDKYITKSTVDLETTSMSEDETESEIDMPPLEEELELQNEPEYDTEEELGS